MVGEFFDHEKLRLQVGQLVNQAWDAAIAGAPAEEQVRLRGVAYDLAARLFIAGRYAGRPPAEAGERPTSEDMARGDDAGTVAEAGPAGMSGRFTDRARRVVVLAQQEAKMLNHNYISTEHILLALLSEGKGVAARALVSLGVSLDAMREQVGEMLGRGPQAPSGHIPFTPRATKVLDLASRETIRHGGTYVGTEHILLALTRDDGVAARLLDGRGLNPDRVRRQVMQLLDPGPGYIPATGGSASPGPGDTAAAGETGEAGDSGEIARLRGEVERLRALLRAHGIDPDIDHGH